MGNEINQVRNIGLIGHSGSGKTSLAEAILFTTKKTNRLGRVDDGTSIMDFEPEEIKRKTTLGTSFHPFAWEDKKFNLVDTPGENDFLSDAKISLQTAEGSIVVIDSVDGVKVGTNKVWEFANIYKLPRLIFINKMDRERADFYKILEEIKENFSIKLTPIYLPIGKEDNFTGLISLINSKSYIYKNDGSGTFEESDIAEEMKETVSNWREKILENIVEASDELMEKYLDGQELTSEEIENALIKGVKSNLIIPIIPGSSALNIGTSHLLEIIKKSLPFIAERGNIKGNKLGNEEEVEFEANEESPFSAIVFKTIADPFAGKLNLLKVKSGKINSDTIIFNSTKKCKERLGQLLIIEGKKQSPASSAIAGDVVAVAKLKETTTGDTFSEESNSIEFTPIKPLSPTISFAIEVADKENEDKIFSSLTKLAEEDPTLIISKEQSTLETILSGTGQVHLENTKDKLKRKFGVEINLKTPKIPYRETIKVAKENVEYKHKKQSGGRGQFAVVFFDIFPQKRGEGYMFDLALTGTNVPRNFVPAVEKGLAEAMENGVVAGYPIVDIKVRFFDGKSHEVDSSEMAFKIAALMCFKEAMREANPILLEPIMNMEISVPEDSVGDIMGDLNGRRGKVLGTEAQGKYQIIKAEAPMAEVLKYSYDLTSLTGGRGSFQMSQVRYDEVPAHLAEKIIAQAKQKKEEEK
ncbi:MAG: elongation factor G [Patescibacteria group bacterium]